MTVEMGTFIVMGGRLHKIMFYLSIYGGVLSKASAAFFVVFMAFAMSVHHSTSKQATNGERSLLLANHTSEHLCSVSERSE